jgi:hypothetical protein
LDGREDLWAIGIAVALVLVAVPLLFFWLKGRPFSAGDVFRASRLSSGNRLFPTQVLITPSSVVHFTPEVVGKREQSIHIAHISSVSIDTDLMFSDVIIETSGGSAPVRCHGHRKQDAVRMKALIEQYQTAYYRRPPDASAAAPASNSGLAMNLDSDRERQP